MMTCVGVTASWTSKASGRAATRSISAAARFVAVSRAEASAVSRVMLIIEYDIPMTTIEKIIIATMISMMPMPESSLERRERNWRIDTECSSGQRTIRKAGR